MGHHHHGSRNGSSVEEMKRWFGYIEAHVDYLAELALAAYPRTSAEYHSARWTWVGLKFFLNVLRAKVGLRPH